VVAVMPMSELRSPRLDRHLDPLAESLA